MNTIKISPRLCQGIKKLAKSLLGAPKETVDTNGDENWQKFLKVWSLNPSKECRAIINAIFKDNSFLNGVISRWEVYEDIQHDLHRAIFYGLDRRGSTKKLFLKDIVTTNTALGEFVGHFQASIENAYHTAKENMILSVVAVSDLYIQEELEFQFGGIVFIPNKKKFLKKHVGGIHKVGSARFESCMETIKRTTKKEKYLALIGTSECSQYLVNETIVSVVNNIFNILKLSIALNRTGMFCFDSKENAGVVSKSIISIGCGLSTLSSPRLNNSFYIANSQTAAQLPFIVQKSYISTLNTFGSQPFIQEIINNINHDTLSEIEVRILESLNWFTDGIQNFNPLHQCVLFVIALEGLLANTETPDGRSDKSISELFAERGAILMENGLVERLRAKRRFKNFYDFRSRIVHGNISKPEQLGMNFKIKELEAYVALIISKLMELKSKEEFKEIQDFNGYVERKLMS